MGPLSFRNSGGMYPSQQSHHRNIPPMLSGRVQNGKLPSGGTSGWAYAGQPGLPPLSNSSRPSASGHSGYSHTIVAQPPQTNELADFSNLATTASSHHNPAPQLIRHNLSLRPPQQISNSRLQQHGATNHSVGPQINTRPANQPTLSEDVRGYVNSRFISNSDDCQFSGPGVIGLPIGLTTTQGQPAHGQPNMLDEFSNADGSINTELYQDRRTTGLVQTATSNLPNGNNSVDSNLDSRAASTGVESGRNGQLLSESVKKLGAGPSGTSQAGTQAIYPYYSATTEPTQSSKSSADSRQKKLYDISELERFGLPGLLAAISDDTSVGPPIILGQDLSTLGLDLNKSDFSPLYPTFASPIQESSSRPVIPEFVIPSAYVVTNVPPLQTKMSSFADETLFAIFYQYPRDILQEFAASELYSRDWRWHKELQQWMMKDQSFGLPMRFGEKQEKGYYIFFDAMEWRKERREFLLNYDHLEHRYLPHQSHPTL